MPFQRHSLFRHIEDKYIDMIHRRLMALICDHLLSLGQGYRCDKIYDNPSAVMQLVIHSLGTGEQSQSRQKTGQYVTDSFH